MPTFKQDGLKKLMFGIIMAPIPFAVLLLIGTIFLGAAGPIGATFTILFGYPIIFSIGLPVYFLMRKIGADGFLSYIMMAFILGLFLSGIFIVLPVHNENSGLLNSLLSPERLVQAAFLMGASFTTVFAFWVIVRPDKFKKNGRAI